MGHKLGVSFSLEHRKNISITRKGMKFTPEHCVNISKSKMGKPSWNTGTGISKEERRVRNLESCRKWRMNNSEQHKISVRKWVLNNPERVRDNVRKWQRANPRSSGSQYYPELKESANNVRVRDKNTCQWYKCGLTFRQAPIHVHHIFPRSEYPYLELVEQYMICYCANHHGLWHRYRGDECAKFFKKKKEVTLYS